MMNLQKISFLFLLIFIFSCQKESISYENSKVEIWVKPNHPMLLSLYYIMDTADVFAEDKRINFMIDEANQWTQASFEIPSENVPQHLMFNFGRDTLLTAFELKDFSLKSQNKTVNFENEDLHLFFHDYEFLKHQENGRYTVFPENSKFNPYLKTTAFFNQRLKIEY